jgi:hypothetical protein
VRLTGEVQQHLGCRRLARMVGSSRTRISRLAQ